MATRFALTPAPISETSIHEAVAQALAVLIPAGADVEWTTFPAGHIPLPAAAAAALFRVGMKRSWPDVILLHDGRIYGIEIKTVDGELSRTRMVRAKKSGRLRLVEGQRDVFPRLERCGMTIGICRSVDGVIDQLRTWGIPITAARTPLPPCARPDTAGFPGPSSALRQP